MMRLELLIRNKYTFNEAEKIINFLSEFGCLEYLNEDFEQEIDFLEREASYHEQEAEDNLAEVRACKAKIRRLEAKEEK